MTRRLLFAMVAWYGCGLAPVTCTAETPVAASPATVPAPATPKQTTLKLPTPDRPLALPTGQRPLKPVLELALGSYQRVQRDVRDYTCVLVRRERVDGKLRNHEFIFAKVRNRRVDGAQVIVPFSVYLKFLKPATVSGREVLYVEGQNDGELLARRGGKRFSFVTTRLDPQGELAMTGNRYPVTEFGIENLLFRLIESARRDFNSQCEVKILADSKIDGRPTTGIIVTHQSRSENPNYCQVRVFVDQEWQLPIHFECYDWPTDGQEDMPLLEQYSYTKLTLNPGLTDADFSVDNPQYQVR